MKNLIEFQIFIFVVKFFNLFILISVIPEDRAKFPIASKNVEKERFFPNTWENQDFLRTKNELSRKFLIEEKINFTDKTLFLAFNFQDWDDEGLNTSWK